ncbi:acyl-CoA thioesterase [Aquimarina agarivorans]|uniref:acyl-CoA thioesterase n=1 Tax=Aquimarina agarivorans TaxID=980584 RepID=UPI000248FCA7|nr:thioesterase family protein [Aquimarina agarivorans]
MFLNKFDIRWSDLDPNQHLANSAYTNFMSATRMAYMTKQGVSYNDLKKHSIGPVVLREEIHYFKEVFPGKPVYVSQEVFAVSEEGSFYKIRHNFYDDQGGNFARGEMLGTWLDMKTRKIVAPPSEIYDPLMGSNHAADFKILTKEETRVANVAPADIDLANELDWFGNA